MLRTLALAFAFTPLLGGCHGPAPAGGADRAPGIANAGQRAPDADVAPPPPPAQEASAVLGHYQLGDTRVEFRDAVWLPEQDGTVSVLLTPSVLSAEEREKVLASTSFPGLPLLDKRVEGWADRYPFVVVKLYLDEEAGAVGVRKYYVLASSIAEPNHTDNLNGFPDPAHPIRLEGAAGTRRLQFSGEEDISGVPRRWAFEI